MTPPAVRTVGLSRSHGAVRALDQLTLEIPRGIIFGLLGPNGSGKTATIRLLLGLLAPTSGYAEVLGFDSREHKPAIRQHSGVLLEHCGLYERLTAVNMEALPEDPALLGDIDQETFHRSAVGIADWIRDYLNSPEDHPVLARVSPGDVTAALPAEAPERGEPMAWILADFQRILVAALTHWNHAGFLGYFPSSGSGPGVLAEFLTAAVNQQAMLWRTSPAATELEAVTLGWLRGLLGLPATFEGVTCDGGSASNLHALMAAREAAVPHVRTRGVANRSDVAPLRVYCSNQAHSSIDKAVIVLGQQALRKIPADDHYRLRPESGVDSPRPPMDAGIALGRRFRALKLWMALRYFGSAGLRARLSEHVRPAQRFSTWVAADADFELLAPTTLSVVCFRAAPVRFRGVSTRRTPHSWIGSMHLARCSCRTPACEDVTHSAWPSARSGQPRRTWRERGTCSATALQLPGRRVLMVSAVRFRCAPGIRPDRLPGGDT